MNGDMQVPDPVQEFEPWLQRTAVVEDEIAAFPLAALSATLDRESTGAVVPPCWHWLYFLPVAPLAETGNDGHPQRGGFLPPVPLPRRMWAAGRIKFHAPLRLGERAVRTSTIERIDDKEGRSGRLVFVTVKHAIRAGGELKLEEEQDIVYRDPPAPDAIAKEPASAPQGETFSRIVTATSLLLFRYSALTFNGHRIHYDYPYATQAEGYPGLVVHGPLIATLLLDLLRREVPGASLGEFSFRAVRPTFAGNPFTLCGKPTADGQQIELWAKDHEGYLTMSATARFA
jgi:3-methylfumaryl-CoA hydratase